MIFDVCIIGAGAAGLMAGITASQSGAKTVIVERNTTAGRKLLKTGRGRCNITHAGSVEELVRAYEPYGRFLKPALYAYPPDAVVEFFAGHHLAMKTEKDGCVFPITDRATDVLRILVDTARRLNIEFAYGRRVETVDKKEEAFSIVTEQQTLEASAVILSTGGKSWSFTGSTGDGYTIAERLGHTIVPPVAAICPVVTKERWPANLQGVGAGEVEIRIPGQKKFVSHGALMFTAAGLGGPAVFDLSRFLSDQPLPGEITVDFCPSIERDELEKWLIDQCTAHPKKELAGILTEKFPRRLSIQFEEFIGEGKPILCGHFSKEQRKKFLGYIKSTSLTVTGLSDLEKATITRGGVSHTEIDSKTMQSKIVPGLFFAGEVIDADGPCGGYNLQIAWSTGVLAGKNCKL